MPRKIRELIRELEAAGFVDRGGKGSHRNYQGLLDFALLRDSGKAIPVDGHQGDCELRIWKLRIILALHPGFLDTSRSLGTTSIKLRLNLSFYLSVPRESGTVIKTLRGNFTGTPVG